MKKFKGLIVALLAAVMAFAFVAFSGCGGGEDVIVLTGVTLNTENAKTLFTLDEDFSAEGLKVTVNKHNQTKNEDLEPEEVALDDANLSIDSSAFVKGEKGKYAINVTYTLGETSKTASYDVTVNKLAAGLNVTKTVTAYELAAGGTEIALNDVTVKIVDSHGESEQALTADKYQLSYYKGNQEVALTDNKFIVTEEGAYQIWATVENYSIPGSKSDKTYTLEGFVLVYVSNAIQSIAFNADAAGTKVSQTAGEDKMSSTWTFTATYADGSTAILTSDQVVIEGLETASPKAEGVANISYTQIDSQGNEITVTTTVNYTVEQGLVSAVKINLSEIYSELAAKDTVSLAGGSTLGIGVSVAGTANYTVEHSAKALATDPNKVFNVRLKFGGQAQISKNALVLDVVANTTVTAYVRSSSNAAVRELGLFAEDATNTSDTNTGLRLVDKVEFNTDGDGLVYAITFEIKEAGTYYLGSCASGVGVYGIVLLPPTTTNVNFSEIYSELAAKQTATVAGGTTVGNGVSLAGTVNYTVEHSAKALATDSNKVFNVRLKFGGQAQISQNALVINAVAGSTITAYVRSSSNAAVRELGLFAEDATNTSNTNTGLRLVDKVEFNTKGDGLVYAVTFEITANGTYYIGSCASGVGVYGLVIETNETGTL